MKTVQQIACVLAIVALTVVVHGKDLRLLTPFGKCQSDPKTHVDPDILQKGLSGELADPTPIGPFVLCMNVLFGLQRENGDIREDLLKGYLSDVPERNSSLVDQVMAECAKRNGTTAQEAALALRSCIHRIIPHEEDQHLDCPPREEIGQAKLLEALKGDHEPEAALTSYVGCTNVKSGILRRNGDVNVEVMRAHLAKDMEREQMHNSTAVDIIVKECGQRKGTTVDEIAWALNKCVLKHIIAMKPELVQNVV